MYTVVNATKEIKGLVDVTIENNKDNAIELAAAWGLYSRRSLRESYAVRDTKIIFRMTTKTFAEWLDIIKSVRGED